MYFPHHFPYRTLCTTLVCIGVLALLSACDSSPTAPSTASPPAVEDTETPSTSATTVNDGFIFRWGSTYVPPGVPDGNRARVEITVKNTGNTTWSRDNVRLGISPPNAVNEIPWVAGSFECGGYVSDATMNARAYLCSDVPPGSFNTFRFDVVMPYGTTSLKNMVVKMVQDGVEWFGNLRKFRIAPSKTYDVSLYVMGHNGDGQNDQYMLSSQEFMRAHWDFGGGMAYQMKNHMWEQIWWDDDFIYRGADTSPGSINGQEYLYFLTQNGTYGARWTPRYWAEGLDSYQSGTVHRLYKSNCYEFETTPHHGKMHFEAHHDQITFDKTGVTLSDVIEIQYWVKDPYGNPKLSETTYYKNGYGMVGWVSGSVENVFQLYSASSATEFNKICEGPGQVVYQQ